MKTAFIKDMSVINEILSIEKEKEFEKARVHCEKRMKEFADNGLEEIRYEALERAQEMKKIEAIYKMLPANIRKNAPNPKKVRERDPIMNEMILAVEKKKYDRFEKLVKDLYDSKLKHETVETMFERTKKEIEESFNESIEEFKKVAGRSFKVLKVEELVEEKVTMVKIKYSSEDEFNINLHYVEMFVEE
jgi:hypothetical protein